MTPQQAEAYIRRRAIEVGVDPDIAVSVWKQESGGRTDLGLRGQTIERGRWKGHYARGPWQIMSFHGPIPDTFEGQTDWALQHLKERGVRGYYGEGTPGVAGHPSTDQYERQVLARAGIDPRMAGDMTGAPAVSPHTLPDRMTMNTSAGMGPLYEEALTRVMGLLADKPRESMSPGNIATALGLGILSARPNQSWLQPAAQSLMQARAMHEQGQIDRPRVDAYRAQTLLATMNQFGAKGLSPDERYRAIRNEVWSDGTRAAVFRYDPSLNNGEGGYLEGPPPAGWSNIDKGMPPGMQGGGMQEPPSTSQITNARFAYPDDEEAQRAYVRGDKKAGGGRSSGSSGGYAEQANDILDQLDRLAFGEEDGIFTGRGGNAEFLGALNVPFRWAGSKWDYYAQNTPEQRNLKTYVDSARGRLAAFVKALGDSGNIGQQEAERMLASLPDPFTDTPDVARDKMNNLKELMQKAVGRRGGTLPPEMGSLPPRAESGSAWTDADEQRLRELEAKAASGGF